MQLLIGRVEREAQGSIRGCCKEVLESALFQSQGITPFPPLYRALKMLFPSIRRITLIDKRRSFGYCQQKQWLAFLKSIYCTYRMNTDYMLFIC